MEPATGRPSLQSQLALIANVTTELAHISDLDELASEVSRLIRETYGYYYVAVFTLAPGGDHLQFRASACHPQVSSPFFENPAMPPIQTEEHIIGYVASSGQALLANDVAKEPRFFDTDGLMETRAEFALPLKLNDMVLGVLDVQSDQVNAFDETDNLVLTLLAENIAIAIQRIRLYNDLEKRNEQLDLIAEVSKSLNRLLDLDMLLEKVCALLQDQFGFPYVHIFLVDYVPQKLVFRAGAGARAEIYRQRKVSFDIAADQGLIPMTARSAEPRLARAVRDDPFYLPNPVTGASVGSELTLPLVYGREVLGVLDLQSEVENAFSEDDIDLLSTLVANISIALRNANLYHSEVWRRKVAENLRDIATELSDEVSLPDFFELVLSKIQEVLPSDIASIWLYKQAESGKKTDRQTLHLAAANCANPSFPTPADLKVTREEAWFFEAIDRNEPVIRSDQDADPYISLFNLPPTFSAIAAPLSTSGETFGLLVLHEDSTGRYGEESRGICASFAGYTAVALANHLLRKETVDQAWLSTILLQVALATQSIMDVDELIATIGQLLLALIGGESGGLVLLTDNKYDFILHSVFGKYRADPANLPHVVQDSHILHEIVQGRVARAYPASTFTTQNQGDFDLDPTDTVLLFPLISRDETLGLLLHISKDAYQPISPEEAFGTQRFAILRGIAQQAAVSLQNINLVQDKQEETYASNVLVQTSNLFINQPDLDVALRQLVTALPALIGVDEVVILDEIPGEASYYVREFFSTRQDKERMRKYKKLRYPAKDFAFVKEFDETSACLFRPLSWFKELGLLEDDELREAHAGRSSSILIYPLAVPGEVYGVLAVSDPSSQGRERRMGILRDIARQVSAAYQNNILHDVQQQQSLLERDFSLARQIQKTFLPETFPPMAGYEAAVYWETARQVGGDFYDIFEIRPGFTGLVIADVSDKGLAAALYMTVSRTLIRASALETDSPAATLEKVNHLLQLDSQQGFFVTVFYGVLEHESGRLRYSNAGHNPPYLLNTGENQVFRLAHGGLALGLMDPISLEENEVMLKPADTLVLYTDGITDTFSPQGQLFTDQRLQTTLNQGFGKSAQGVVQLINEETAEFRSGAPLSDDNTLLVVRRE